MRQRARESLRRWWAAAAAAVGVSVALSAWAAAQTADKVPPPPARPAAAGAKTLLEAAVPTRSVPVRPTPTRGVPTGTDAAGASGDGASAPADGGAPAGGAAAASKTAGRPAPAKDDDIYALPEDFKYSDGSFNQDALVVQQKKRVSMINKCMSSRFRCTETLHYLILSDADAPVTAQFQKWSEALYNHLFIQLGFPPSQHVWDGKCVLILASSRSTFLEYARRYDNHDATSAGAYCAMEGWPEGLPQLVHVAIPTEKNGPERLQELFAHEGTHAFFEGYRHPGHMPLWLHEGLAEYMTIVNDRTLKAAKWSPAVKIAQKDASVDALFKAKLGDPFSLDDYSVATTMVDYLITTGRMRFKTLIDNLKDGKDQETALAAAYGVGTGELVRRWRPYVVADGGTKPAPADPRPMAP